MCNAQTRRTRKTTALSQASEHHEPVIRERRWRLFHTLVHHPTADRHAVLRSADPDHTRTLRGRRYPPEILARRAGAAAWKPNADWVRVCQLRVRRSLV